MSDRRLLIAAGQVAPDLGQLPFGVQLLIEAAEQILVISPRLPSRLEWLASATDRATQQADERLGAVLGQLEDEGVEAQGEIGADDPLTAFEDAVGQFSPSHLLIALRQEDEAGWQERGLLESLRERVRLPITIFEA